MVVSTMNKLYRTCSLNGRVTRYAVVISTILGFILARSNFAETPNPEVATLYSASELAFKSLTSIEFEASSYYPPFKKHQTIKFQYSQPYFIVDETSFFEDTGTTNRAKYAYNGTHFQELDATRTLGLTQKVPKVTFFEAFPSLPILVPYLFVFDERTSYSFADLINPNTWNDLAKRSRVVREGNHDGHPTFVVEVDNSGPHGTTIRYTVHLAKDLDFFPLAWSGQIKGANEVRMNVSKYMRRAYSGGNIMIPLRVEVTDVGSQMPAYWISLDESTLQVGHQIAQEAFTIPSSQARRVYDADSKVMLMTRDTGSLKPMSAPAKVIRRWWLPSALVLILLVAIVLVIYYSRRKA